LGVYEEGGNSKYPALERKKYRVRRKDLVRGEDIGGGKGGT